MTVAAAAVTRWLTRQRHGIADKKEVLTFWLAPSRPEDTQLRVGVGKSATLTLQQWKPDVVGKGTGGYVWGGARRLAAYLAEHGDGRGPCPAGSAAVQGRCCQDPPPRISHLPPDATSPNDRSTPRALCPRCGRTGRPWDRLTVLELGSGTGAGGLAASLLGSRDVTLTDQRDPVFAAEVKVTLLLLFVFTRVASRISSNTRVVPACLQCIRELLPTRLRMPWENRSNPKNRNQNRIQHDRRWLTS